MSYTVKIKKRTYYKEDIRYNKVGSPTVEEGVASGLSYQNYLTLKNDFNPSSSNNWQICLKFKLDSLPVYGVPLFSSDSNYAFLLDIENNVLVLSLSNSGTNWNIGIYRGTTTLELNTWYMVRLIYFKSTSSFELDLTKADNVNFKNEINTGTVDYPVFGTPTKIGGGMSNQLEFKGEIDLKESYINPKINYNNTNKYFLYTKEEVPAEDYTPVTEGFSESFGGISVDFPVVTQVGSSDLYKVYWEHLKGASGTYTEPAYTSYIKKTEFDALANERLLTQYNEDGSLFVNPKPMYKVNQYLAYGESYRIGSPNYFFVDDIKSYVPKRKIRKYRKNFVMPVLTSNGTMGGSTFAVDCSTHNASLYETFNAGSSGKKNVDTYPNAAPQWESFYSPVPLKVTQLRIGQIKDTAQAQHYYITAYKIQVSDDNETWIDVYSGTGSKPATTLTANIADSGYHKYYRVYVTSAPYYSGCPRVFFYGIDFDAEAEDAVFYDEVIESYVVKRKIRRYYKYEYEDWEQPNFTGYTTNGAVVSATSEDTGDGRFAWKALQTSTQPAANTNDNYGKYNTSTAVWKVKFPYLLKISKIEHQARNWNNSANYNTVGAYYADEDKTKKIGDINSSSSGAWTAFNVDYLTDTILLDITGGGSWAGIGRLKITAQKATPVEVSASDDWDYYIDTEL